MDKWTDLRLICCPIHNEIHKKGRQKSKTHTDKETDRPCLSLRQRKRETRQGRRRSEEGSALDTINTYSASPFLLMDHLFTKRLGEQKEKEEE